MLVLTRKPGERILIGENSVLSVITVSGSKVRIGIEAPRDIHVIREELEQNELEKVPTFD